MKASCRFPRYFLRGVEAGGSGRTHKARVIRPARLALPVPFGGACDGPGRAAHRQRGLGAARHHRSPDPGPRGRGQDPESCPRPVSARGPGARLSRHPGGRAAAARWRRGRYRLPPPALRRAVAPCRRAQPSSRGRGGGRCPCRDRRRRRCAQERPVLRAVPRHSRPCHPQPHREGNRPCARPRRRPP